MMRERVLVTGAGGFIGGHVVAEAERRGWDVLAMKHRWSNPDEFARVLDGAHVARCIHLGWYADPSDYLTAVAPNLASLQSSLQLFSVLFERGCRHVVVAGSSAEYGPLASPHDETERPEPWSTYGSSKAALHLLLASSWRPPSTQLAWARLFNITGPFEHPARLVPRVTRSLLVARAIDLSPGEQRRDFLDVTDVAGALVALSEHEATGTYNVCSGEGISLHRLLGDIGQRIGAPELLRFGSRAYGPHDPMSVVGSNERLREVIGWERRYDYESMIQRVVEYWERALVAEEVDQ